ncbi:MAG: N-acetyltransferase family protein, partial [Thermoplasmatota archaeon]
FREELLRAAKFHNYVFADQSAVPYRGRPYPEEYETYREFDGHQVFFRPVKPTDERLLQDLFYDMSEKSVYQRFMSMRRQMPHREVQPFANIDHDQEMAIVGLIRQEEFSEIVAVARYMVTQKDVAEVAFVVRDDWQGKGIGTFLLNYLIRIGRERGLRGFVAEVLPQNTAMLHLFQRSGLRTETQMEGGSYQVYLDLAPE